MVFRKKELGTGAAIETVWDSAENDVDWGTGREGIYAGGFCGGVSEVFAAGWLSRSPSVHGETGGWVASRGLWVMVDGPRRFLVGLKRTMLWANPFTRGEW
jgi:hypothetical protein